MWSYEPKISVRDINSSHKTNFTPHLASSLACGKLYWIKVPFLPEKLGKAGEQTSNLFFFFLTTVIPLKSYKVCEPNASIIWGSKWVILAEKSG